MKFHSVHILHIGHLVNTEVEVTKKQNLSYIYLGYFVCLCVCVSQFVSERSAILLVLAIKLTKETRRRVSRGRDRDGKIGD